MIIAPHLVKMVADDLGGSSMRIKVSKILQSLSLILITSTLYMEVNSGGIIAINIIESNSNNDYIHIWHDL